MRSAAMNGRSTSNAALMSSVSASASEFCARRIVRNSPQQIGSGKNRAAGKFCRGAKFFLDAEKLIVFGDAVSAGSGTGLDLARSGGDGEVGDKGVFGFAAAVRNDGVVSGFARKFDGVNGFRNAADLIELDENRVGNAFVDAAGETLRVGDEKIVADELDFLLGRFFAERIV